MALRLINLVRVARGYSSSASTKFNITKIGLLGVPYDEGGPTGGIALAPSAIRDGGLIQEILEFNEHVEIKDFGDVTLEPNEIRKWEELPQNMKNYNSFMALMHRLSEKVCDIRNEDRICVTLGGDHSIAVGE